MYTIYPHAHLVELRISISVPGVSRGFHSYDIARDDKDNRTLIFFLRLTGLKNTINSCFN